MKKTICVLLCAVLLALSFAACGDNKTEEVLTTTEPQPTTTAAALQKAVTLPFTSADTLNPFMTESRVNQDLAFLLFDPLFQMDAVYDAVPVIAEDFGLEADALTVKLRSDVRFTSGELLTARDVVYSFQCAKSSPLFAPRLENFFSCMADGDAAVRFTLLSPDLFAVNCLDFPIIKFGTGEADVPTGSGRYQYKMKNGAGVLVANDNSSSFDEMTLTELELFDLSKAENPLPLLQIGELSCYLLDPTTQTPKKISAATQTVHLNNFVYCALNSASASLQDAAVRAAIRAAVDRTALIDAAYNGAAQAAQTPFNPAWSALETGETADTFDAAAARALLEDAGYSLPSSRANIRTKDGEALQLDLVVNSENSQRMELAKLLKAQLENVGIGVTIQPLDYNSYLVRLQSGSYDLYLGEVRLTANMDLSVFFSAEGGATYGIDLAGNAASAYADWMRGGIDLSTLVKVFNDELPLLPICYRDAVMYYTRELQTDGEVSENNLYGNLYTWSLG